MREKKERQEKKKGKSPPKSEEADTSDRVGAETDSGNVFSSVVAVGHTGNRSGAVVGASATFYSPTRVKIRQLLCCLCPFSKLIFQRPYKCSQ